MSAPLVDTAEIPRYRSTDAPPVRRSAPAPVAPAVAAPRVAPAVDPAAWVPRNPAPALAAPFVAAPPVAAAVVLVPAVPPIAACPSPPGRAALRAERLAARRERRLYACLGLGALAGMLGATIFVLDVLH
jgi:hypothetical protein